MAKIQFLQIREGMHPTRAHEYDAGIDFYVPKFTEYFIGDLMDKNRQIIDSRKDFKESPSYVKYFQLLPSQRAMIPSGFKCRMSEPGRALIAANKSGIASKHGLVYGAQVIDYTYKGEIHLNLINTSDKTVNIHENMKIVQFIEIPIFNSPVEIVQSRHGLDSGSSDDFYSGMRDDRGEGGFGSTDKKDIVQLNS